MSKAIYSLCILIVLLFPCGAIFRQDFASRVKSVLRQLKQFHLYDGILNCTYVARAKAESIRDYLDGRDSYYAVILINMYSNPSCSLSYKKHIGIFYERLNKEMQNIRSRGKESKLWLNIGTLMNKALKVMGLKTVNVVYRGCAYYPAFLQPEFSFRKITSTSTNPRVAEMFSNCTTFILIEDALGLDIKRYAQNPDELEILLQSTNVYFVEKYTRNDTEIREEMADILPEMQPEVFVRLRQKHLNTRTFLSRLLSCSFGICRTSN